MTHLVYIRGQYAGVGVDEVIVGLRRNADFGAVVVVKRIDAERPDVADEDVAPYVIVEPCLL